MTSSPEFMSRYIGEDHELENACGATGVKSEAGGA